MASSPSPGRRGPRQSVRGTVPSRGRSQGSQEPLSPPRPLDSDRRRIEDDLKELERKEAELRRLHEAKIREMEDLPRKIAEREQKQRELMKKRAYEQVTDDVFSPRRDRRPARLKAEAGRMTRPEQRAARLQFLVLCTVLAALLLLLWKSLP